MSKEQQTERIGLRVTPTEVKMLEALAETTGLSGTNVLRQLLRREFATTFPEQASLAELTKAVRSIEASVGKVLEPWSAGTSLADRALEPTRRITRVIDRANAPTRNVRDLTKKSKLTVR